MRELTAEELEDLQYKADSEGGWASFVLGYGAHSYVAGTELDAVVQNLEQAYEDLKLVFDLALQREGVDPL